MNKYGTERCRCGQCDYYWLTGIGSFCQGSGFEKEEAEAIARLLNEEKETNLMRVFYQAATLGLCCGLQHRYEWYCNASRALIHGPYTEIGERETILLEAFTAFEKNLCSCPEEEEEFANLDCRAFLNRVEAWYAEGRKEQTLAR
jgi:hypothetical protein